MSFRVPTPARWAMGALAGAASWFAVQPLLTLAPSLVRFVLATALFTLGPGLAVTLRLTRGQSMPARIVIAMAFGGAASAVLVDVLGRLGGVVWFPYVALAIGAAALAGEHPHTAALEGLEPRESRAAGDRRFAAALVVLALTTGAVAFSHRVVDDSRGIRVYGDYDSLDLAYYASITSEAAHTVPPTAPYYAGRGLNYAYYPQLVPAMVHRFAGVPVLDMYFGYLWPWSLALASLTGYLFVRRLAPPLAAFTAIAWLLVGGDFSYIAAWALPHGNVDWDYVLWPTNFLSPTMEVLHFNSWTPSLPLFFAVLFAAAEAFGRRSLGWAIAAGALLAVLFQFKPFAFLVLFGALSASWVFAGRDRHPRQLLILIVAALGAIPFVVRALSLYGDRRSELRIDFFLLPERMLIKLDLVPTFQSWAAGVAPSEALAGPLLTIAATLLFLIGGIGMRWIGVPSVLRALRPRNPGDPAREPWRVLAWVVVVGVATPFVLVTEPYHDTLQFYQAGLYALWIFAGVALVRGTRGGGMRGAMVAGLVVLASLPSSAHYLARKWTDDRRPPFTTLDTPMRQVASYLQGRNPQDTVVLHDRPLDPSLLTVVAGRRVVLAWARYAVGSDERRHEVDAFFDSAGADPAGALRVLQRYDVSHVVVRTRNAVHADVLARLSPVLRAGDVTLFAVPPDLRR